MAKDVNDATSTRNCVTFRGIRPNIFVSIYRMCYPHTAKPFLQPRTIMKNDPTSIIDSQKEGAYKNFVETVTTNTLEEAHRFFQKAKKKLLDINHWHVYSGVPTTFQLTNQMGNEINRIPEKGDYFKIDIPGPGSKAGEGYDWVHVEKITQKDDATGQTEYVALNVHPASHPAKKEEGIAHFLSDKASSSFIVKRDGTKISAEIYGRNEQPNLDAPSLFDKARNALVAGGAIMGMADIQWDSLARGLLSENKEIPSRA